ncbi:predicted protein [Nematostella vectensis]|uniref:Nucleoporin NUP188 n=1 Tax=Nematostella vectensis TaxID=45351 RepID=A7S363_NEMVE|nr:predicted protein [Nematostella vectensis]|eukprot:XP_001633894.1 predicted protein [Nematostella vectensis]
MGGVQEGMGVVQEGMCCTHDGMGVVQEGMGVVKERMCCTHEGMGVVQEGMDGKQKEMGGVQEGMGRVQEGMAGVREGMDGVREGMGVVREGMGGPIEAFGTSLQDVFPLSIRSTSSLDKIKQSENVKDFIKKLSKFMDLDVIQTFELFSNYLHNDFRGTPQQLKQKLKNDSQTEHLMLKILDYYFEERLHILQCVKYLLSYWQDPNHAFREQFMECLNGLQDNNTLITKEKTRNCKLTLQYLQEQSQGFGMRQINRHIFDGRAEALIPQISYLQVLVLIESFDLEGLRNHMDDGSFTKHHIVQEPAIIEELDKIFVTWGDLPQHGPIMLAWAVFRYVTMETDQEQAVRRIGSKALQCHVFEYLESMLTFEAFSASSPVAFICKSLVYGLMFIVLGLFQEDTLGDIKLLVSVLSLALMEKGLCIDFWDTNLSAGAGLLLKSAAKWFPLQFSPFLQLLKSLAGEEESAAKVPYSKYGKPWHYMAKHCHDMPIGAILIVWQAMALYGHIHGSYLYLYVLHIYYYVLRALTICSRVFQYVSCLSSYTEQLRENKIGDVDCIGDDQVWKIITPKVLYKNVYSNEQHIVIDSGTLGALIPNQGSAVVQWSHRYSGWKLFLFEIDSYLQSVSTGTSTEGERVIATVDLINEILKNNWSKAADLGPFISRLHLIVQRCSPSPSPPLGLIASCLRCLATVASHDPLQVWFGLQQTGFLPYCTSAHTSHNQSTVDQNVKNMVPLGIKILSNLPRSLSIAPYTMPMVFQYVSCLSSYTEQLRENKIGDVDCIGDDQVWKIITPKVLYKNVYSNEQHIVIDSGTLGALIPNQGSAVVQWSHRYSGWKLFLFEIDSYLQSVSTGTSTEGERVIATVDLINEILKNNWSKEADLGPFISRLHLIVQRCSPSPSPPLGLIASCLRCLATVASHDPLQVWFGLQQTGFLPYCTSAHTSHNQSTVDQNVKNMVPLGIKILSNLPRSLSIAPYTMPMLVCGIGQAHEDVEQPVNFLDLAACVVFVIREVFTGFHKWRFTDVKDREEIGEKCLEIFNAVLGLRLEKSKNESRDEMDWDEVEETRHVIRSASVLPDVLSHALLQSSAGQPLLNILCTGVDTVDRLISLGGSTGSHALAVVQLIKLAFSVLSKLLNRKHKASDLISIESSLNEEISPLEQALSTQVIQQLKDPRNPTPSSPGQSQLVTVISSYIYHRMDSKLPTLATLLLKRLCLDLKLKVAILEFIATAVETQPGLIELFLDLNSKRKPQHLSLGDHSCLHAVLNIINPIKKAGVHMPSKLVSAAFLLLHALWFDRRDAALTAIRNSPKFWENLTHPLFTDINNEEDSGPQLQTCSYSLQIVAMESYYVASGQLDDSLKTILKDFISKQRYQYWSKFVKLAYPDESVARRSPRPCSPLVSIANDNDHLKLLRSWRTFLVVAATVETSAFSLTDSKLRCEVLEETLSALKSQVSRPVCAEVMTAAHELSALYLVLLRTWKSALRKFNSAFVTLVDVLETANRNDTQLLDHIRSPVFSCISILLQHARSENKSGEKCLEIFNAVLGLRLEKSKNESRDEMDWDEVEETRHVIRSASVLPDVLSHALLQSSAGQPLLNILCTGVDTVDRLISLGGSTGSHALAVVQLIKLAFSVLSKLLNRKHKASDLISIESSLNEEISPLEQALSTQVIQQLKDPRNPTPSSPGQSQLVTVISSYIYHRMDSKLPTLATLLLKRLCLDLKLKVAILEFIATAVETQPGLIELFLDLNSKRKPQHLSLGDHSCLHAVLNIINPIKKAGVHMPSKLVSAAFLLLHALWFDRRDAALTAIRNSPKFWENLTHPLFTDINNEEDSGPQLQTCSYSLQIVAMESYYVASGQLDDSLKTILKDFISKQRYQYWSKFVKLAYPDESVARRSPRPRSPLVSVANDNDHLKLLRSWRTFLVVAATVETSAFSLTDSKLRCEVLEETLSALKSQVSRPVCAEVMTAAHELSALYLVLLRTWKSALRKFNSAFVTLVDVLETANRNDTQLLDHIRSPVFSCISILLQHARSENKSDTLESSYAMALLPLACEPLEYLNGRLGKQNDNSRDRVLELSVFIIDEILNILLSNPGQWLPVLREHALFASLVTALDICVKTREKLEFAEAVLHLFLSLSRIPVSAEALAINNLSQTLCLGIASLFNGLDSDRTAETQVNSRLPPQAPQPGTRPVQQSDSPSHRWTNVWRLSLAVMASMLRTLRFGFLKEVFDFAGVHREQLAQAMDRVRTSQSAPALAEAEEVTELLLELAHFPKQWSFTLPDVLGVLQYRAGVLCQTCIALLTHPRLLAHLLEMSSGNPLHEGSQPLTDISLSLSGSFASRGLLRSYSYADEDSFRNNPVVSSTQSKLLKILCNTLAMLRQFTPDICEILLDEGMDIDEHLSILALVFSSPAIDHEEPLSFGTLLACLNMCLTHMSPESSDVCDGDGPSAGPVPSDPLPARSVC